MTDRPANPIRAPFALRLAPAMAPALAPAGGGWPVHRVDSDAPRLPAGAGGDAGRDTGRDPAAEPLVVFASRTTVRDVIARLGRAPGAGRIAAASRPADAPPDPWADDDAPAANAANAAIARRRIARAEAADHAAGRPVAPRRRAVAAARQRPDGQGCAGLGFVLVCLVGVVLAGVIASGGIAAWQALAPLLAPVAPGAAP